MPARRRRLLLLLAALAAVVLLAVEEWTLDDSPAATTFVVSGSGLRAVEPAGPAPDTAAPDVDSAADVDTAAERLEAVRSLAGVTGVLVGHDTLGLLEDVTVEDSTFFGAATPFVTPRSFASGDVGFDLLDVDRKVGEYVVRRVADLDSLLRADAREACDGYDLQLRLPAAEHGGQQWSYGFARGAVDVWRPRVLATAGDTLRPDSTAVRLALAAPGDTAGAFRDVPLRATTERLAFDGAEILIAHAWRSAAFQGATLEQQLLIVAERTVGAPDGAWKVAYRHESIDDPDQVSTLTRSVNLLAGTPRRPVLLLDADYRDGGGGVFVGRVAPGVWREVASWYAGC